MLITLGIIFLVIWLLGLVGVYSIGAWAYVFLVLAVIFLLVRLMGGSKPPKQSA
ncbi:MAG TPA: DUF5670 family protein [Candidatus Paceibacterota bacterium]|jgi:hypothetical protein|nr:DUF5670 family protein [Candidatus Paceibacterota bacterium]